MKTKVTMMRMMSPPPKQWQVFVLAGKDMRSSHVIKSDLLTKKDAVELVQSLERDLK